MTKNLEQLESAVNDLTRQGKIIDSIDQHYADECVFTESDGSARTSKREQRAHLQGFLKALKVSTGQHCTVNLSAMTYP